MLHASRNTLRVARSMLHAACFMLHTTYCTLRTAREVYFLPMGLHTTSYQMLTTHAPYCARSLLHSPCSTLHAGGNMLYATCLPHLHAKCTRSTCCEVVLLPMGPHTTSYKKLLSGGGGPAVAPSCPPPPSARCFALFLASATSIRRCVHTNCLTGGAENWAA